MKYFLRTILPVIMMQLLHTGFSQQVVSGFFKNYRLEDGLKSLSIQGVTEDHRGIIWVGTQNGLSSFDGYNFRTYFYDESDSSSISGNRITSLKKADYPYLWVGTYDGGLCKFNTLTGKATRLGYGARNPALPHERIVTLFVDKFGITWVCSSNHFLSYILPGQTTAHPYRLRHSDAQVKDTLVNPEIAFVTDHPSDDSLIVIAASDQILIANRITGRYKKYAFEEEDGRISEGTPHYRTIIADADTSFWICSWGDGILNFNPRQNRWQQYLFDRVQPLSNARNIIYDMVRKNDSTIWIATADKGLGEFNTRNHRFSFYRHSPDDAYSVLPGECNSVFKDHTGGLWASTQNGLSNWYAENQKFHFVPMPVLPDKSLMHVYSVLVTYYDNFRDEWLIGADMGEGLYVMKNGQFEIYRVPGMKELKIIEIIPLAPGSFIACTYGQGLFLFDRKQRKITPYPVNGYGNLSGYFTYSMESDQHYIYIGTWADGLFRIDKQTRDVQNWKFEDTGNNKPGHANGFRNMYMDPGGKLWYTLEEGYGMFDCAEEKFTNWIRNKNVDQGKVRYVQDITSDGNGKIWICTYLQGVLVLNEKTYEVERILTLKDGIASGTTHKIKADKNGDIWLTTSLGLNFINHTTFEIKTYSVNNGLSTPGFSRGFDITPQGYLAIGAFGGLYLADIGSLRNIYVHSRPVLTDIRVNDQSFIPGTILPDLSHEQNNVYLHYTAPEYQNQQNVEYAWMLEGMQNAWSDPSGSSEVTFYRLKPGRYRFSLKYRMKGESWGPVTSLVSFYIQPAWWQTRWFYAAVVLLFLALVFMVYLIRVRQIRKNEKMKTAFETKISKMEMEALRSQMNPHFLFNSLNSIRLFIMKNEQDKAADYLTRFSQLVRMILNHSKTDMITLEEELQALKIYIELEKARFDKSFDFVLDVDDQVDLSGIYIPPMIIQPFIENAIWHGLMHKETRGELTLRIRENDEGVSIEIKDNGIGRKRAAELKSKTALHKKSYGMQITTDRIDFYNKTADRKITVSVMDLYENGDTPAGTRIVIQIKYSNL